MLVLEGVSSLLIGSLSNNDSDGYENVTLKGEFAPLQT